MSCPNLSTSRCMLSCIWTRCDHWTTCGIAAYYSWIWHTKKRLLRLTGCWMFRLTARQLNLTSRTLLSILKGYCKYKWNDKWCMVVNHKSSYNRCTNHWSLLIPFHHMINFTKEKNFTPEPSSPHHDPLRNPPSPKALLFFLVAFNHLIHHAQHLATAKQTTTHLRVSAGRRWVREPRASASCLSAHPWKAREDRLEDVKRENTCCYLNIK